MKVLLAIGVGPGGALTMSGPLHDKVQCYGLLEAAKDMVREYKPEKPGLFIPPPGTKLPRENGRG